jgi:predicted small integral membrane protein
MITLIAVVCILIAVIMSAVQSGKIRAGWVPQKFAGRPEAFLSAKRKEYSMLAWLGVVAGPIWLALAFLDWGKPAAYERIGLGVVFIVCGIVMFALRSKLPTAPVETRS